jgi:hypothetical protein
MSRGHIVRVVSSWLFHWRLGTPLEL